ncbi:MAG: hypothetical protein F6K19_08675 [Cyanothece sp. SIO1E1]|nr:hypothetical protein [Cyanothece sp. SIO1E1]
MELSAILEQSQLFPFIGDGKVERTITPRQPGRVYFQATYWPARFYQPNCQVTVCPGEPVKVVGRDGLTLLIVPVDNASLRSVGA